MSKGPKLIKIAPIAKGSFRDLSYFSAKNIKTGDLVLVEIRKKEVPAAVLGVEEISKLKTTLRKSPYSLKRISEIRSRGVFTEDFLEVSKNTAKYFVSGTGSIINELSSRVVLDSLPEENRISTSKPNEKRVALVLQASRKERLRFYRNLIRGEFAKGQSVFLCLPSPALVKRYGEKLKRGIEGFTFALHGKMPKKKLTKNWQMALGEKHPILVISTGSFLSIPREDISYFILEKEGSPFYKSPYRPFIDIRVAVQNLAKKTKSSLILGDEIIRTETYNKELAKKIIPAVPTSHKITSNIEQMLADTRNQKSPLGPELQQMIRTAHGKNEKIILFINRRGHGSSTICNDCGHIVSCSECDTPMVLHKGEPNIFFCHKCLFKTPARSACPNCNGWNLRTLGWGIQQVEEEVLKLFPSLKIFRLDSDTVKTKKQAEEMIESYTDTPGSILLATEMLFTHFDGGADRVGIISVDGLFNMPDFRINEKIFRLLLGLKMRSKKTFLVQTRMKEHPVFKYVLEGDIAGFYQSELEFRKALGYPPFKTLIKIGLEGKNKAAVQKEIKKLEKELEPWEPISFPAFTPRVKNLHKFYILLRLEQDTWPHKHPDLCALLSTLSPNWKINVDPESLL
jgi:primosomal protein N' (replication factor Y)